MILFIILTLMIIALLTISILAISAGGIAFIILFGDLIVCIFIIYKIIKRRKKK